MKAFVLAAGFATRMYPLTLNQAKPLLEVGGRPMLTRLADQLSGIDGLDEIIVIGNEKFAKGFSDWAASYKGRVPVRVLNDGSTDDSNKLGAIGDIAFALDRTPGEYDWTVVAGDNLFEFNPADFAAKFAEHREPMIVIRENHNTAEKSRYNEVILDERGIVRSFREKPPDPQSSLVAICFYFFPPSVKPMVRRYLDESHNPDAPGYFIQWLVKQTQVRAARFDCPWFDIGNLQTLEEARKRYAHEASSAG